MKNKISFTSVLKSKGSRNLNLSSTESSSRHPRLIDLYQDFQANPNKPYTLQLSAFKTIAQKSRNSSITMLKSNHTNEDPQMNLDQWVQQNRQNFQSITRGPIQKSLKGILPFPQDPSQSRRTRSNFNKNTVYPQQEEEQNSQQFHQLMENSKRYEQIQMEQSKKTYQRNMQKPSVHFQSQQINQIKPQRTLKAKPQNQQNPSIRPQEFFIQEQLMPKTHYPNIQDQDYKKLQDEFQRLKQQKIAELCMQTKKSVKKQKLQQIISKALENIYSDIDEMAGNIIMKRRMEAEMKKAPPQDQVSEQMLISGCNDYHEEQQLNQSLESENNFGDQKRKQEMRNMIKGYISGIQQAKSQGKASTSFSSSKGHSKNQSLHRESSHAQLKADHDEDSQEPSFNYQSNTFSNQVNHFNSNQHSQSFNERKETVAKHSIPESVGYSFANSNMVCEHSFNKEIMDHNNFQNQFHYSEQNHFQKNQVNPPIYEPQNSDNEEQQRISLPNIEEVKSDCGDFINEQLESSEAIDYKRNKMQNLTIDLTGNNIKNIESVHYEPPTESYAYQGFQAEHQRKDLFKNFEQNSHQSRETNNRNLSNNFRKESNMTQKDEILKEQKIPSYQDQKFVSKTFSSYLSGQIRSQYGQAIRDTPKSPNDSSYTSKQTGFGYKIQSINRYSPSVNKASVQKITTVPKSQNLDQSFQSISSPREQNLSFINNANNSQAMESSKIKNQTIMNESSQLSLNNSINQQPSAKNQGGSSKNIHQLQSKTKFSINSPMHKIDQMISNELKTKNDATITEFNGFGQKTETTYQFSKTPSSLNSYAVSSPIGAYKTNDSIPIISSQIPQNMSKDHNYACAQSISSKVEDSMNQPFKEQQNSILSMQPLKMSLENSLNVEKAQILPNQSQNLTTYQNQKVLQSREIHKTTIETSQKKLFTSNISNGRIFLQQLHEKQSIEIEMSPESKNKVPQQKRSFVAQTFRPTTITVQQPVRPTGIVNDSHSISSNHKTSITKITLRSSDRNNPTSQKVISLSINQFPQKTEVMPNMTIENKQNVFEKLTIKESKNFQTVPGIKVNLTSSINHQAIKNGQTSNIQNHVDINSKENNNTMNNSSIHTETKTSFSAYQKPIIPVVTQKREPLLKLSKNFGNTTTQQSMNVKKSMGESIKTKVHPISSIASSKGFSGIGNVKQSIKNVNQSIGNDSDMDFDIELD